MEKLLESLEYTVPELAELWKESIKVVIRMAAAEKILVKCLLRDVISVTVKSRQEECKTEKGILQRGFPSLEEYLNSTESETQQAPLFPMPLNQLHLQQMVLDGFADISVYPCKNGTVIHTKSGGNPAKAIPKDCFISGKDALQIEEKYNLGEKGKNSKAGKSDGEQTASQKLTLPLEHEHESSLLKIAVECWKALYEDAGPDGKKIRKPQIEAWVQEHYPDVSANSRKTISTIVNPFKKGGASPSE